MPQNTYTKEDIAALLAIEYAKDHVKPSMSGPEAYVVAFNTAYKTILSHLRQ